jgi:Ca2+/H+ antiporter
MEAEASGTMLAVLLLVIGIALFVGAIATRLQMEKEFKEGTQSLPSKLFLYLDSSDFSEKGNALRKRYNIIYSVLTVYSLALFIFMKAND